MPFYYESQKINFFRLIIIIARRIKSTYCLVALVIVSGKATCAQVRGLETRNRLGIKDIVADLEL
jgi:hypothetical protein